MGDDKLLTAEAASALTGYSARHIRRLARLGIVDGQLVGGHWWLIDKTSMVAYARKMRGEDKEEQ